MRSYYGTNESGSLLATTSAESVVFDHGPKTGTADVSGIGVVQPIRQGHRGRDL